MTPITSTTLYKQAEMNANKYVYCIGHQFCQAVSDNVTVTSSLKLVCDLLSPPTSIDDIIIPGKMGRVNCTLDPVCCSNLY